MREIVDQLIEERAPWMRRRGPLVTVGPAAPARRSCSTTAPCKVGEAMEPLPGAAVLQSLYDMLAQHVEITGLENIPRHGPAMVVCNHPTGIADGIVLFGALSRVRPDLFIFANADAMRVLPQLGEVLAPVEWRPEKRTHKQNRETMDYARRGLRGRAHGGALPLRPPRQAPLVVAARAAVDGLGRDDGAQVQPARRAAAHHRAQLGAVLSLRPHPPDAARHHPVPRGAQQDPPALPADHRRRRSTPRRCRRTPPRPSRCCAPARSSSAAASRRRC